MSDTHNKLQHRKTIITGKYQISNVFIFLTLTRDAGTAVEQGGKKKS